ncbi:MAG: carbamoyl-phosphate synthase large subunit [Synergistaceae bacterium]|nr:carbamoyl-phosphate synthase large subunit [Synergistaceae bacterium]
MPKRQDIKKILIIGSGPIVIGQACEFDYSGTQACKALRSLGYSIVLVNSNPATIMTDPETADVTYIEPLNAARLTEIIKKERPDALLPNLGGQSGLNLCFELAEAGVLKEYGVEIIGVDLEAIRRGEDRIEFKKQMDSLGVEMARSNPAYSVEEAKDIARSLGYPVVIRPAYTMGGAGGGFAHDDLELETIVSRGVSASMIGQVLIEESILGWEELEVEVVRDRKGRMITVCLIENIDALGVHTGDSFCCVPMLTCARELQDRLEDIAHRIVQSVGVIGGCNVQFAHDPKTGRVVVIEINPRTSRSSALASKATGFPVALVSATLATGVTLDEIPYCKGGTLADYRPSGDYIVIKFARWAFEKLKGAQDILGTQMKAVGEVMSIGKTYKEALQKAVRSLETSRHGLGYARDYNQKSLGELMPLLQTATSERQFILYEAIRKGADIDELCRLTHIKRYYLEQMRELVELEEKVAACGHIGKVPPELLRQAKLDGFSDKYLAKDLNCSEAEVYAARAAIGAVEGWDKVPVSNVKDRAYYYSTYNRADNSPPASDRPKVMILGGGPNRIGQGIEFDYCCVHAAFTLRELGYETIIVNCNPETVSTDYDTSDKLYFEPLTVEDVLAIYEKEKPIGVIAQFGGQTPLNLAAQLDKLGVRILGTSPQTIDMAEDRDQFRAMMDKLGVPMPKAAMGATVGEALAAAKEIGYPLMVRPSYVLGGAGMRVVLNDGELTQYMLSARGVSKERPVLIDRFLQDALEVEADAISDGKDAFIPAVMEHIEQAGVHSGDSACVLPSVSIGDELLETIKEYSRRIAVELGVCGLMNIQYAIADGKVYILEANPRASRTVPLVSKVCGIAMVPAAVRIIMASVEGKAFDFSSLREKRVDYYGVKEAVFPFNMFPEVDPQLGPEMLSTGEVLGMADTFGEAFYKSQEAAKMKLPQSGAALISVSDADKEKNLEEIGRGFHDLGFSIMATSGTARRLAELGIPCKAVGKLEDGSADILNLIGTGQVNIVVNTPTGGHGTQGGSGSAIRKAAIRYKTAYVTTAAAAKAAIKGIASTRQGGWMRVKPLQEYYK